MKGHLNQINGVAYSPDNRWLASASSDTTVRIWDLGGNGQEIKKIQSGVVSSLAFSPDGSRLAGATWGRDAILIWDVRTGQQIASLSGHTDDITCVTYNRDGTRLASASKDKTIRILDSRSGEEICVLQGGLQPVSSIAFNPTEWQLVSASGGRTVHLWGAHTDEAPPNDGSLSSEEIAYRRSKFQSDPLWHDQLASDAADRDDWFAACFHRAWQRKLMPKSDKVADQLDAAFEEVTSIDAEQASLLKKLVEESSPARPNDDAENGDQSSNQK